MTDQSALTPDLGNIAQFASTVCPCGESGDQESGRGRAYRLQKFARKLLPKERVAQCQRAIAPGHNTVEIHFDVGHARYKNLVVCDSYWTCPFCARRIGELNRKLLGYAVRKALKLGLVPIFATFTLSHHLGDRLAAVHEATRGAWRFMKGGRRWQAFTKAYGIQGNVRGLEVTVTTRNGWHEHIHAVFFAEREMLCTAEPQVHWVNGGWEGDLTLVHADLHDLWTNALAKYGFTASVEHGVQVQLADTKIGLYLSKWGIEHEIAKSSQKVSSDVEHGRSMFQLLDDYAAGDLRAGDLFVEFANVFKGAHQLHWSSPEFKARLLDGFDPDVERDPAADLVGADQGDQVESGGQVVELTRGQWAVIAARDLQWEVQRVAARGDPVALWAYLYAVGVPLKVNATDLMWAIYDRDQRRARGDPP